MIDGRQYIWVAAGDTLFSFALYHQAADSVIVSGNNAALCADHAIKRSKPYLDAGYFDRNVRMIEVLLVFCVWLLNNDDLRGHLIPKRSLAA